MTAITIDEITLADEPAAWSALGFDVDGETCVLGTVAVRLAGSAAGRGGPGGGLAGWSLRGAPSVQLDGLPTSASTAGARAPAPAHANGVVAIDHVVAVSPDLDRTVAALQSAGLDLRRVRERPTPAGAPRQAFFRLGEVILETVQEPDGVIEAAGGTQRPAHFWGLALLSEDIERTAAAFGEHCGPVRDAVQEGRRIATVKRSAGLCVPVALMSMRAQGAMR
jgi:hypothetical protein